MSKANDKALERLDAHIEQKAQEDDALDNHRNAPHPAPACLYGLIGDIARAGSDNTEANPFAVAANALAFLGCAIGRSAYLPVGNTWHHANLFCLHVGRSGRGRKGDAVAPIRRIASAMRQAQPDAVPQIHSGGLSSREGLAFLIHDGYTEGKEEVPPVLDKRLLVIESEFANVLGQTKRDGNTLSAALRDLWDGLSIRPATKTNRLSASHPHVALAGSITPSELKACIAARDLTNGFANRFLIFWAERQHTVPFPRGMSQKTCEELALRVLDVLDFCKATRYAERDTLRVELSPPAVTHWAGLYKGELNDLSHGERINALIERRAPMCLRLAMIFALCDKTTTIEPHHLDAAMAWVRFSVESVKFVFGSVQEERETEEVNTTAQKIVAFLKAHGTASRKQLIVDCFRGHASKDRLDTALDELLQASPPRIVMTEDRSGKGRPTKNYQLTTANYANKAQKGHESGFAGDFGDCEQSELCEQTEPGLVRNSGIVSAPREQRNQPQTPMDRASSQVRIVRSRKNKQVQKHQPAHDAEAAVIDVMPRFAAPGEGAEGAGRRVL